jgi:ubiquinone/menaquinone biosynthesis C-methylase UbiE
MAKPTRSSKTDPSTKLGVSKPQSAVRTRRSRRSEGWHGWDDYAPFYDWENAQTLGRRDVAFWRGVASRSGGRVLELGCGTGRVSLPLAEAGVNLVGIDRSAPMLARAAERARTRNLEPLTPTFVRGDIRALPFQASSFAAVIAPYGILQSLIRPRDLSETLAAVARVIGRGGLFGIDLVPDVPKWREYRDRVQLRGRAGPSHLTLVESVTQDRRRQLTTFNQRYIERRGGRTREHRFDLIFRTLSVRAMTARLQQAGFAVNAVLGDYEGGPWDDRADVWIILARKG